MFRLDGKVALITGATGGIGSEIARTFHAQGATVVLSGNQESDLKQLASSLGGNTHVAVADMSNANSVNQLYADAEAKAGQVDILVCCAGITRDNLMVRMSDEEFDDVIRINLKAIFLLNREAMKSMSKRRYGRIINISSVVGRMGNFGQTNYAAAKAGLIGMTKSAALEGATRGVTANCIAPGFVKTPMTDVIKEEIKDKIKTKIPMGVFAEPKDIATAAVYLASEEARMMTGATLDVNAGMYMI